MRWSVVADAVMDDLRARLIGRDSGAVRVDRMLHYGAVEIDTSYLVVWVLLAGAPDEQLPEWSFGEEPTPLDIHLVSWLAGLRNEIRAAFAGWDWPASDQIKVGVDSSHRVAAAGGRSYFQ